MKADRLSFVASIASQVLFAALISCIDIANGIVAGRGVAVSARSHRGAALLILISFIAAAPAANAQERKSEEERYAALFGEVPGESSGGDASRDNLFIAAIRTEVGDGFVPAYVRSFVREIRVGQRLTRSELESALEKIRERMEFSRRFYGATLSYVTIGAPEGPSKEIAVEIRVSADGGFWWDFNFEPYDLSIAYGNLFRKGKELGVVAGLNTQSLSYRDPSIGYGKLYWNGELGHRLQEDANVEDGSFLYESLWGEGEAGLSFGDDFRLGAGAGYAAFRAPESYFLYPDREALGRDELEFIGIPGGDDYGGLGSFFLHGSAGAYSYRRRGGAKGRVEGKIEALVPRDAPSEAALKCALSGDLRFDAPRLLRLTLHEKVAFFPRDLAGGGIPEPLWADIDEGRYRAGLVSGEFASLSRASLGLDPIASIGLAFTRLDLIPEVYYEFTAVRMAAYGDATRWGQNVGVLLKGAFDPPVNRVFSLGFAFSLPSDSAADGSDAAWKPGASLFLEIE